MGSRAFLAAPLGQGATMVAWRVAFGGLLSIWVARALSGLVAATRQFDAVSISVASVVLMIVSAAAALPAARRAARTDPLVALRNE
jgi:ABC-type antimicrobial peptide transport system permease subunit